MFLKDVTRNGNETDDVDKIVGGQLVRRMGDHKYMVNHTLLLIDF
jgi:hypothetical protein